MKVIEVDKVICLFRLLLFGFKPNVRESMVKDFTALLETRSFEIADDEIIEFIHKDYND